MYCNNHCICVIPVWWKAFESCTVYDLSYIMQEHRHYRGITTLFTRRQ